MTASFPPPVDTSGIRTVKDFGAIGDNTADDTNAIKAAIATGNTVVLPNTGRFKCTDELVLGTNAIVSLGADLAFPTDLGVGKYAIRWTGTGDSCQLVDCHVRGPGYLGTGTNSGNTPGVSPANMRGVWVPAGGQAIGGSSRGFDTGYEERENNERFIGCFSGGNLVGHRRAAGASAGDQVYENFKRDRNYLADFHIDINAQIIGAHFIGVFCSDTPYAFYAPAGGGTQMLVGCDFIDCGFEGYGNAIMYGGGTRGISAVKFMGCGEGSGFAGPSITGNTKDAAIHAYTVSFETDNGFPAAMGAVSIVRGDGQVSGLWKDMDNALATANTAGKPMVYTGETADALFGQTSQGHQIEFCRSVAGNTVAPNELVETFSNGVRRYLAGAPRGVALAANYTNGPIPVMQSGMPTVKSTDTTFNGVHAWAKGDSVNPGTVIAASGPGDGATVGVNVAGLSGGLVKLKLHRIA